MTPKNASASLPTFKTTRAKRALKQLQQPADAQTCRFKFRDLWTYTVNTEESNELMGTVEYFQGLTWNQKI